MSLKVKYLIKFYTIYILKIIGTSFGIFLLVGLTSVMRLHFFAEEYKSIFDNAFKWNFVVFSVIIIGGIGTRVNPFSKVLNKNSVTIDHTNLGYELFQEKERKIVAGSKVLWTGISGMAITAILESVVIYLL